MLEGRTTNSCRRTEFWGSRDPLGYGVSKQPEKDKLCSSDWISRPCSSYTREDEGSLHWHHIQNKQGCFFLVNRMLPMWKLNLKSKSKQKAKHSSNVGFEVGGGTNNRLSKSGVKAGKEKCNHLLQLPSNETTSQNNPGAAHNHTTALGLNPKSKLIPKYKKSFLVSWEEMTCTGSSFTLPQLELRYPWGYGSMYGFTPVLPVFRWEVIMFPSVYCPGMDARADMWQTISENRFIWNTFTF